MLFNPFDMTKRKSGFEFFILRSKENTQVVKETISDLIKQDAETFCNRDVVWEALDACQLTKSDFDKCDWEEIWDWTDKTYKDDFWY